MAGFERWIKQKSMGQNSQVHAFVRFINKQALLLNLYLAAAAASAAAAGRTAAARGPAAAGGAAA